MDYTEILGVATKEEVVELILTIADMGAIHSTSGGQTLGEAEITELLNMINPTYNFLKVVISSEGFERYKQLIPLNRLATLIFMYLHSHPQLVYLEEEIARYHESTDAKPNLIN